MPSTKAHILSEIQRTAALNAGVALGWRRFETNTGIGYHDWYGRFWTKWNDAIQEAGLEPNRMSEAYSDDFLLEKLVLLTRNLQRVPTKGDLLIASRQEPAFPSEKVFRRLGSKASLTRLVLEYCSAHTGHEDVEGLWRTISVRKRAEEDHHPSSALSAGFVYMLKHGSRAEYKIGRTNNSLRRIGEIGIELPEKVTPVHYIETDDPSGVESYWHRRFATRRKGGEWFALSAKDVRAFKRWKKIY